MSKLKYFSETEQLRFDAISREKFINDQASLERSAKIAGRVEGRAEGEAIGLKKGKTEGRSELLSELIKQGVITEEQAKNYRN